MNKYEAMALEAKKKYGIPINRITRQPVEKREMSSREEKYRKHPNKYYYYYK